MNSEPVRHRGTPLGARSSSPGAWSRHGGRRMLGVRASSPHSPSVRASSWCERASDVSCLRHGKTTARGESHLIGPGMTMVAIRKADRQLLSPGIRGPTPSSEDRLLVLGVWVLVLGVLCLQSSWPELGVDDMFGQGTGPAMGLEPCAGEEETLAIQSRAGDLEVPHRAGPGNRIGVRGLQSHPGRNELDLELIEDLVIGVFEENRTDLPSPSPAQLPQHRRRRTRGPGPGDADEHHHRPGPWLRRHPSGHRCSRHRASGTGQRPLGRVTDTDSSVPLIGLDSSVGTASAAVVIGSWTSAVVRAA